MGKAVDETAVHRIVLSGKPIEQYGLSMYGLPMRQYEEWAKCKNVWLARQSTFPVFCVSLPFLDAIFALDMDAIERTGQPEGWLYNIMYCLGLSLRLGDDCVREQKIHIVPDDEELTKCALGGHLALSNENSLAGKAFLNIARRIGGESVPILKMEKKKFFGGLIKK